MRDYLNLLVKPSHSPLRLTKSVLKYPTFTLLSKGDSSPCAVGTDSMNSTTSPLLNNPLYSLSVGCFMHIFSYVGPQTILNPTRFTTLIIFNGLKCY